MSSNNTEHEVKDPRVARRYRRYYTYIEPVLADPVIKGYFTLVASMLLIAFFIIFALSPTFSTILGLTRKIEDQKRLIKALDTKISNLIIAQENYTQVEPLLPILMTAVPQTSSPQTVFAPSLAAATASAVLLANMQFAPVDLKNDPPPKSLDPNAFVPPEQARFLDAPVVSFRIEASAPRSQLRDFVGKLERLPRMIRLSTLTISIDNFSLTTSNKPFAEISGYAFYLN